MLPPVWCASHVVGEKPPQAAWDRPWVPWEGCRPRRTFASRRATGWASATSQETSLTMSARQMERLADVFAAVDVTDDTIARVKDEMWGAPQWKSSMLS